MHNDYNTLFIYVEVLETLDFSVVRRILRRNTKSMEQRGIFVQIQIKIISTKLSLWTVIANNLKLSLKSSILFLSMYEMV